MFDRRNGYDVAPPHARYPHVLSGYRPIQQPSLWKALFSIHNETLNAWSHVMGAVYSAVRMHEVATSEGAPAEARASVCIFLFSAAFCFTASAVAHSLAPVVHHTRASQFWAFDLLGICVLIGGSYVPGLRWSFRCRPTFQLIYTAVVGCSLLCGAALSRAQPADTRFGYKANLNFVKCVIFTAGFGLVCVGHWCTFASAADRALLLPPVLTMFSLYGIGVRRYLPNGYARCETDSALAENRSSSGRATSPSCLWPSEAACPSQ